jgi:hypothetical protein
MWQNEILMSKAGVLFDFVVLVLTTTGLYLSPARSSLWQLLFRQGIIYFIAAFVANMVPTIFLLLNLNCACFLLPLYLMVILFVNAIELVTPLTKQR